MIIDRYEFHERFMECIKRQNIKYFFSLDNLKRVIEHITRYFKYKLFSKNKVYKYTISNGETSVYRFKRT